MLTNFFPINIDFKEFEIRRTSYSKELLDELRAKHNHDHSFFRDGDFIYVSPDSENPITIGDPATLKVQENEKVVSSLIKHIFFRAFRKHFADRTILEFYPFTFLSQKHSDDLVYDILSSELRNHLAYRRTIEIQFRKMQVEHTPRFGAVITTYHKWIFDKSCAELADEGFNLFHRDVVHSQPVPNLKGIIAADQSLVGILKSIDHPNAIVETNDGDTRFDLNSLFLDKSRLNISDYLTYRLGASKAQQVFGALRATAAQRFDGKNVLDEVSSIARALSKLEFRNSDNFVFSLSQSSDIPANPIRVSPPTFIFDPSSTKTHKVADIGLNNFGPYDEANFDTKNLRVLVLCHRSNRGRFSDFLGKMKEGIGNSKWFKKGILKKYYLHEIDFQIEDLDDYSIESYISVIDRTLRENSRSGFQLAILETKQEFKNLSPLKNPYFQARAHLLSLNVPVQFVSIDKVIQPDEYLENILNSISLQIYAKLGGTAWVVPASRGIDRQIVVGLASSWLRKNKYVRSEHSRIVGITTFFSAEGKYHFGRRCRDVAYEDYFEELLTSLKSSIEELSRKDGWKEGDTVRIIVHIFKPLKEIEAEVINRLAEEITRFKISFCFVTISEHHPFLLFDKSQQGIRKRGELKGRYVPERSQTQVIDDYTCLLQMKGPRELKTAKQGLASPLLVKIHPSSTFRDLPYIIQQVYTLTYLSWRSFLPCQTPVTVLFSSLIADQLHNMREIAGWNPEVVNGDLKYKKWFL